MVEKDGAKGDRPLSRAELREVKPDRAAFAALPRRPITVVLDRVRQNYNIGAIFRLCHAFLVERLIIGGCRRWRKRLSPCIPPGSPSEAR